MDDHILKRLVNRSTQHENFVKMLDGATSRRIMTITAPAGMGKSWLLHSFVQEVRRRGLPYAQIDFADRQGYDGLALTRRIRDSLGVQYFDHLTASIQEVTTPHIYFSDISSDRASTGINFGSAQTGDISIQDVAGMNIIKNNLLYFNTDRELMRQAAEDRIYSAFFLCLRNLSKTQSIVLLFDSYERLSNSTSTWESAPADHWIRSELLHRIRDRELTNVIVVLAGRLLPAFDHRWATDMGSTEIAPLRSTDVEEYLRIRLGLKDITPIEALRLYQAVDGMPYLLGVIGDNLLRKMDSAMPDDLW